MNSVRSNNLSLKYQRFTPSGWTQFLPWLQQYSLEYFSQKHFNSQYLEISKQILKINRPGQLLRAENQTVFLWYDIYMLKLFKCYPNTQEKVWCCGTLAYHEPRKPCRTFLYIKTRPSHWSRRFGSRALIGWTDGYLSTTREGWVVLPGMGKPVF